MIRDYEPAAAIIKILETHILTLIDSSWLVDLIQTTTTA